MSGQIEIVEPEVIEPKKLSKKVNEPEQPVRAKKEWFFPTFIISLGLAGAGFVSGVKFLFTPLIVLFIGVIVVFWLKIKNTLRLFK